MVAFITGSGLLAELLCKNHSARILFNGGLTMSLAIWSGPWEHGKRFEIQADFMERLQKTPVL